MSLSVGGGGGGGVGVRRLGCVVIVICVFQKYLLEFAFVARTGLNFPAICTKVYVPIVNDIKTSRIICV